MDLLISAARKLGPIPAYRVMVLESSNRISHQDFATREEAEEYARDVRLESDDPRSISIILDRDFRRID